MSKQLINQGHVMSTLISLGELDKIKKKMNLPEDFGETMFFEKLSEVSKANIDIIKGSTASRRTHFTKTVRDVRAMKSTYNTDLLIATDLPIFSTLPNGKVLTGVQIINMVKSAKYKTDNIKGALGTEEVEDCKELSAYTDIPEHLGGSGQGRSLETFDEL